MTLLLLVSSSRLLDNLFPFFLEGISKVYTYVILPDSSLYYDLLTVPALYDYILVRTAIFIVALYYYIRRIETFFTEIDIDRYYNKPRSGIWCREIRLAGPICLGSVYRLNFVLFELSAVRCRICRICRFL
jgi:hypothetical protein